MAAAFHSNIEAVRQGLLKWPSYRMFGETLLDNWDRKKGVFSKMSLFVEIPEILEILEIFQVENGGESDHFLEILGN